MSRPPHIRRSPKNIFNQAALAPLRIKPAVAQHIDLFPTPFRKYLLAQVREGRIRWHQRLGWRLHAQRQNPQAQNANVRDMVRAGWVTEAGDAVDRTLTLTETGQAHAAKPPEALDERR